MMPALVRSELIKLRTLRSTLWVGVALLAIAALTGGLAFGDAGQTDLTTPAQLREPILAVGYAAALFLAVLGANAAAGEYRHGTISHRYLASPARGHVLGSKLVTYALVGLVTAVVLTGLTIALAEPQVSAKGLSLGLGDEGARLAGGIAIVTVLAGMLGVVVGTITRNPTSAMVGIFGWLIAEKIVGGYLGDVAQYLPFALIENVLGLTTSMAWGSAALALAGITAVLAVIAQRAFVTKDVT